MVNNTSIKARLYRTNTDSWLSVDMQNLDVPCIFPLDMEGWEWITTVMFKGWELVGIGDDIT